MPENLFLFRNDPKNTFAQKIPFGMAQKYQKRTIGWMSMIEEIAVQSYNNVWEILLRNETNCYTSERFLYSFSGLFLKYFFVLKSKIPE